MNQPASRILFIVNKHSGNSDKEVIHSLINNKNFTDADVRLVYFRNKDDQEEIKKTVESFNPATIVACGGDGTVAMAGNYCVNTQRKLGIIPMGSSNALSKNLGIPADIKQALNVVKKGYTRKIDVLKVHHHNCFHVCDIGFNAALVNSFNGSRIRGMIGYAWYFLKELFSFRFFGYKLMCGENEYSGKAYSITITNFKMYGTKVEINPMADMDDGKFEICIVKQFPAYMLFPLALMLIRKKLPSSKYSHYVHCVKAEYENISGESIQIDGEPVELPERFTILQMQQSLNVIVPHNAKG